MEKLRWCTPEQMGKHSMAKAMKMFSTHTLMHQPVWPPFSDWIKMTSGRTTVVQLDQGRWLVTAAHCFRNISNNEIDRQGSGCVGENNYENCDRSNTAFVTG